MAIERMQMRFQANPEVLAGLSVIREQNGKMFSLIEMFAFLAGEEDFVERQMRRTSVGDVLSRSLRLVREERDAKGIVFEVTSECAIFTRAHPHLLQWAFQDILRNAVKAIREADRKTGRVTIATPTAGPQKNVRVDVKDNGCGMTGAKGVGLADLHSHKAYERSRGGGALSTSRLILEAHHGHLRVASKLDEGTTVSIFLPKWSEGEDK
jgi:signal transduction histidine kinase